MEEVLTNHKASILPLLTILISGIFLGRVGNQTGAVESPLRLYPNIETMGVAVSGVNLPQTAQLMYRQSDETDWRAGHPLVRIPDGRLIQLVWVVPSTTYEVKVSLTTELIDPMTTQPDKLQFTPIRSCMSTIMHPRWRWLGGSPFKPFRGGKPSRFDTSAGGRWCVSEAVTFPVGKCEPVIQVMLGSGAF
jgi:hypothetical protein